MEINLRNVPFSEEILFFIRRCAGDSGILGGRAPSTEDLEVRLQYIEVPNRVYEVCLVRHQREDDVIILETDPDVYIAVRNAFEILKARDRREGARRLRVPRTDGAADAHT